MIDRIFNTYSLLARKAAFLVTIFFSIFAYKVAYFEDTTKVPAIPSIDAGKVVFATYYFPQWHVDPFNMSIRWVLGFEWERIRVAKPRLPEYSQPKKLLLGYPMEHSLDVMAQKVNVVASDGVGAFSSTVIAVRPAHFYPGR